LKEKEAKLQYENILFQIDSKHLDIGEENSKQIEKDLARTYPCAELFKSKQGQSKLMNVLTAFSKYDAEISKCLLSKI
jgi:hypothetical protein